MTMNQTPHHLPDKVQKGIQHFNQGDYYEAHEWFEDAWRETPDPSREFYRALLHISGGFYRLTQGKPTAAKKFFSHAEKWLSEFPDDHQGFDLQQLRRNLGKIIKQIDQGHPPAEIINSFSDLIRPPQIVMNKSERG